MHKPSLPQLVYNTIFPKTRSNDPASFAAHISRNLVPEVRIETSTFYGTLDCIEAQYPGLDYSYQPHRMRLNRFPWHKKLFKAFDVLGLTEEEIASLCRWEGTKSARERYERDEGVKVRDTTSDDVVVAVQPARPSVRIHSWDEGESTTMLDQDLGTVGLQTEARMEESLESYETADEDEDTSEDEVESYGVELNQRLLEATAARERGADVPLDEDWEQWLKEAVERGGYSEMFSTIRSGQPFGSSISNGPSTSHSNTEFPTSGPSRPRPESMPGTFLVSAQSSLASPVTAPGAALRPRSSNPTTGAAM